MPYTLVTAFDDCVKDYPFLKYYGFDVEQTEQALVRHLLFSDVILIDSAFFILNNAISSLIQSDTDNILRTMLRLGRIKILSETGNIVEDVSVKQRRQERESNKQDINNLNKTYSGAIEWLKTLSPSPYLLLSENGAAPLSMRRSLISRIFDATHPHEIGSLASPWLFNEFQTHLSKSLIDGTSPRSVCKKILSEIKTSEYEELRLLTSDVMTYANEAFHLCFAAHLADVLNTDVHLETIYSNRFSDAIPYK